MLRQMNASQGELIPQPPSLGKRRGLSDLPLSFQERGSGGEFAQASGGFSGSVPTPAQDPSQQRPAARAAVKSADGRFIGKRAKKPKLLAIITDACTGCAGAPVCQIYCPVVDCMLLVPAEDMLPAGRIWVDPLKCVGCRKCVSRGPDDAFLDGCPWDAIVMVPTSEWEVEYGELPY